MGFITVQGLSSPTFNPPPLDGSFCFPSPNHPLFVYADEDIPKTITWSHAVDAFWKAAHIFHRRVEPIARRESAPIVVAILASTDQITYLSIITGIMLAGYLPFPLSTRNSDAAIAHLLESTSCAHICVSADPMMQKLAGAAQAKMSALAGDLQIMPVPTFQELFERSGAPQNHLPRRPVQLDDPAVIMHSSGSTAFPKTIPLTHRIFWESGLIPYHGEVDLCGEVLSLPYAAYTGMAMAGFSPAVPPVAPTPDRVFDGAIATNSTFLICAPTFLEVPASSGRATPARVSVMKKFITVIFGGGPLQPAVGDELVKNGVHLVRIIVGQISFSLFDSETVPKDGWDFFPLSPHTDPGLVPLQDRPDIFQVYFKKCPTHTPSILDSVIDGVPALNTKDLILRHPTNPNLWKIFGRQDDQIIHSNGEKTNPVPIEKILLENPAIKYAIMFGRGNFHAGVIIFPEDPFDPSDTQRVIEFRRIIWPTVEQANRIAPTHSRIFKEMILVASLSKPIEVTAKGTPRRQAVLEIYAQEIARIYSAVEDSFQKNLVAPIDFDIFSSLEFVRKVVGEVMPELPADDADIFQHGCDSLQATWIRNSILHAAAQSKNTDPKAIPTNFVYSHPTVRMLAEMLTKVAAGGVSTPEETSRRAAAMQAMVEKYTQAFPQHISSARAPQTRAVLVTGTTGAFGSHILAHLLASSEISVVYAFNRPPSNLRERQCSAFLENGIDISLLDSPKLKLLTGDLNTSQFGLSSEDFNMLRENTTLIVHNAWQVNFNVSLATMEPLVAGTRQLVDFSLQSPHPSPPRLLFVSTAGVFRNFDGCATALEGPISDPLVSVSLGYTESKWVAEQVLEAAAQTTTLSSIVIRPGQLSGAANGAWNASDWFPVLLRSSQLSGHLPRISGLVSWIPIHHAAKALVEMQDSPDRYLHISHPNPVPMEDILSPLSEILGVPLVPYSVWLESLEAAASQEAGAAVNPAVRLIDFFRSYRETTAEKEAFFPAALSNTVAIKAAPSLQSVALLSTKDADGWTSYLRQKGHLG
ncbi:hypothetical protein B0H14DRAFT_2758642 [Mycena olivaceomarginata]|nr:hypothetical protein B0H14DRAFT_2758642 [Mycena olivaceomarginata]